MCMQIMMSTMELPFLDCEVYSQAIPSVVFGIAVEKRFHLKQYLRADDSR